ncbi:hypothetical protein EDC31_11281 [Acidomonas methanolica]|nr:hypothetical protein EDC31_11281 [Acidomonas methanolica]
MRAGGAETEGKAEGKIKETGTSTTLAFSVMRVD